MPKVTIPNGETVQVPQTIDSDVWFIHEKVGYLNPKSLAPYPKQPRMYIDPDRLCELTVSVETEGVREDIIITPVSKAPWASLEEDDSRLFLIVSGHRRVEASLKAMLAAVPVKVRIYNSKAAFDRDATTLNEHRENLSEIEEGWAYRNKVASGEKITHISRKTGKSYPWLMGRIHLTYLDPSIQALISPKLKSRQRLAIGFASALGAITLEKHPDIEDDLESLGDDNPLPFDTSDDEKRFRLQRAYISHCKKRCWRGVDSENFVRYGKEPNLERKHNLSSDVRYRENGSSKYEIPSHPRMRLLEWFRFLNKIGLLDMKETEIDQALSYVIKQDLEEMADLLILVSKTLHKAAKKKSTFSDIALGTTKRPEQKVLEGCYKF